jgi:hypothetical protein
MAFCYISNTPVYRPQLLVITAITQASPAVVTTNIPHNYLTGTVVRLWIPLEAGMQQLANQEQWFITVLSPTTFSMPVDTSSFDAFVAPAGASQQCAQVFPVGEDTFMLTMASTNIL